MWGRASHGLPLSFCAFPADGIPIFSAIFYRALQCLHLKAKRYCLLLLQEVVSFPGIGVVHHNYSRIPRNG